MEIRNSKTQLVANDADLSGSNFSNSNLAISGFDDVNLRAATFTDCNLSDVVFDNVNLSNASISNANIEGLMIDGVSVCERLNALSNKPGAVIFAKDIARMMRFYEHVLAMKKIHSDADWVVLESPCLQLTLHAIPQSVADGIAISDPPTPRKNVAIKLCFPVVSIAVLRAAILEVGGGMNPPVKEWKGSGFTACDGHDPEGNIIQFRENEANRVGPATK